MVLSKAEKVLREIERMAGRRFLPIVGFDKGKILIAEIREAKPKRVLEVGTLIGYSAILMGKELPSDALLVSIEIHPDEAEMAKENIAKAAIPPRMDELIGDALEVLPKVEGRFDLVFIDAEKSGYLDYLRLVEDKLSKGSIVAADNAGIFANEMKEYLTYVRSSGKYSSRYVPVGEDGLEISVKC